MRTASLPVAGFWRRTAASVVDTLLLSVLILPLLTLVYGEEYWTSTQLVSGVLEVLLSWILPAVIVLLFWLFCQATPGKMLFKSRIVDANTGSTVSPGQLLKRYLGYYLSMIPLGAGFLWVAIDGRKQGWHDKIAGTLVIREES